MDRPGIGIDTCLLQVADSYLSAVLTGQKPLAPAARQQFIELVDFYLDQPGRHLVVPKSSLGHLGELGRHAAAGVALINNGIDKNPMTDGRGIRLYRQVLDAVADPHDPDSRDEVLEWAVFQLHDRDVLLGYADRMERPGTGNVFVEDNDRADFWSAYRQLNVAARVRLSGFVDDAMRRLDATRDKLRQFQTALLAVAGSDGKPAPNSRRAATLIPRLLREIDTYPADGEAAHETHPQPMGLFCLAYAGSVSRRVGSTRTPTRTPTFRRAGLMRRVPAGRN